MTKLPHLARILACAFLFSALVRAAEPVDGRVKTTDGTSASEERSLRELLGQRTLPYEYRRAIENYLARPVQQIIAGTPAQAGEVPWQVSLGVAATSDARWAHFCGGALYRSAWVITAAHCVFGLKAPDIKVVAGVLQLDDQSPRLDVDGIFVVPGFDKDKKINDLALIHLRSPIELSPLIQSIDFVPPEVEDGFVNRTTQLVISGWGANMPAGLAVADLQRLPLPYVSLKECSKPLSYPPDPKSSRPRVIESMVCAGRQDGGASACQGDSGGGLVYGAGAAARLVGVDSWAEGCAVPYKYTVFTRVNSFKKWVEDTVASAGKN